MLSPAKLKLQREAPLEYQDTTKFHLPEFFSNYFTNSGCTLTNYPDKLKADYLLTKFFPIQALNPSKSFIQLINFTANFYKNTIKLPQFLGCKTGKHYHFLLGASHSKKLRYSISTNSAVMSSIIDYAKVQIPYISADFPEFSREIDQVHQLSLHIGILRSELLEIVEFADFDVVDPLVRLFAVVRCQSEEVEIGRVKRSDLARKQLENHQSQVDIKQDEK